MELEGNAMRIMAILAGAAFVTLASPALAEDWDFVLINNAGKEIKKIEIAPTGSTSWVASKQEEGIVYSAIKSGGRTTVHFDKAGNQCRYDVKVTFADGSNGVWSGINVCDSTFVTIRFNGSGAPIFAAN